MGDIWDRILSNDRRATYDGQASKCATSKTAECVETESKEYENVSAIQLLGIKKQSSFWFLKV
jgi:hypothetical protein